MTRIYTYLLLMLLCFSSVKLWTSGTETVEPPRALAREILQPLGMPVVSLWLSMRESLFLNYAHQEAEGLEALGDWVLTPCRYLLGGSDAFPSASSYFLLPSCDYSQNDLLKTAFSALIFPISAVVGSTIKGMAYFFPKARKHYQLLKTWQKSYQFVSKNPTYTHQGIPSLFSPLKAPCLHLSRPSRLSNKHQVEIEALKEICTLLNRHQVVYWLDCGSALGAYRYQGMIPWDDDIDLSIISEDHENVKYLLSTLDPAQYQIQDWSSGKYPHTLLKLYIKKTKTLIDIYHYRLDSQNHTATYFYSYRDLPLPRKWKRMDEVMTDPIPYEVIFPLRQTLFDQVPVWVPHQLERFLHYKYGENISPTMIWDETSQSYLKVKNHPYWQIFE